MRDCSSCMALYTVAPAPRLQFEERGVKRRQFEDGVAIEVAATKYWVKWDEEKNAKVTTRLNITRMFEELIKNKFAPDEVKAELAHELNNATAKNFLKEYQAKQERKRTLEATQIEKEEHELKEKKSRAAATGAKGREQKRQESITKYVQTDPPLPQGHYDLCLYLLSVAMVMSRLPFALISNPYFRTFLKALRPKFEETLGGIVPIAPLMVYGVWATHR